ncbi:UNVERIFIED_CONTAM: hypothetical protein BJ099_101398 [Lysinibacillus xylanilyticus]
MCHAKISNSEQLKTCCELADQALYTAKRTFVTTFTEKVEILVKVYVYLCNVSKTLIQCAFMPSKVA